MALPATREEREPADDALLMVGVGRPRPGPGRERMGSDPGMGPPMDGEEGGGEDPLPPGFDVAASEAFPDMDPSAYPALKRLIALCMEKY